MLNDWQKEEIQNLVKEFAGENPNGYYGDRLGELVDSYIPIYNSDIISEGQAMPNEYDDEGAELFGRPDDATIIQLMALDLMNYYGILVNTYAHEYGKEDDIDVNDFA